MSSQTITIYYNLQGGGVKPKYYSITFFGKEPEWKLFHLALQNKILKTIFSQTNKTNPKICEFDQKS